MLRIPLSEPLFLLGTLFILLVFFVPGGLASLPARSAGSARGASRSPRRRPRDRRADRLGTARRRAPLLLIHGLGYARWGWEPVLPELAEQFDVILFDNRGIGESDAPPGPYTVAEMADDAVRVLDEAGVERAHVLGTSLGGMIAQELALSHPERVDRLVLACTTPGGPNAHPMPQATVALMAEAATLEPAVALRRFVENALSPTTVATRPEIVDRILAHRLATAQAARRLGGAGGRRHGVRRARQARRTCSADPRAARR